jgi:hypothetical protein
VFAMKLKIIIGTTFNVFSVIIQAIGISEIWNASFVLINKFMTSMTENANIAHPLILIIMENTVQYVQTIYSITLIFTSVFLAQTTKFIIRTKWFVSVLVIILLKLLKDVFNVIFLTISM